MSDYKQNIFFSHVADEMRSQVKKGIGLEIYYEDEVEYPEKELLPLIVEVSDLPPELSPERKDDGENAVLLHQYLFELDPTQASDKRLWTYLAHGPFRKYVQKRWPLPYEKEQLNINPGARKAVSSNVLLHWFINTNDSRGLKRHALARLWWAAHLTYAPWKYDEKQFEGLRHDDEYVYTRFIMSNETLYTEVAERVLGSSRHVLIAFLQYFMENPEALNRKNLRPIVKEVNLISGVKKLSALSFKEIYDLVSSVADEIVEANKSD